MAESRPLINDNPPGYSQLPPPTTGYAPDPNQKDNMQQQPQPYQGGYQTGPYNVATGPQPSYVTGGVTVVQPNVVVVGGCPACRVGVLEEDFTCCGVLLAILFFPIGLLCCLAMRERRCPNCGAVFG